MSLDATGEQLAIQRQCEDCLRIAAARGWQVIEPHYIDNSISAWNVKKKRPGYDRMVRDYKAGLFDAIVVWDLDRLTRQPRQLEDWIDAAERRGLLLVTANGEADLTTDGGRMYARIKAAVARAESDRKAVRQSRALQQRAESGKPPLGVRLTGYTTGGEVIEAEAKAVREMFSRFHQGDSLHGIAAWLNAGQVRARSGRPWNPSSVRTILTNPRYAGRAVYRGEANGKAGTWPPLADEAVFDAVNAKLADPRRRKQVGTDRKHLGSGLYQCGTCGQHVRSHGTPRRYRCPRGCVTRSAVPVDDAILRLIRARLAKPDLASLITTPSSEEARAAADQIKRLRGRLAATQQDYDADLIDGARYKEKSAKITAELDQAEARRARLLAGSDVAGTLTAADPVAAFNDAPLGVQQAVIRFFMTVELLPAPRGRHGFDPETVRITPKHPVRGPQ